MRKLVLISIILAFLPIILFPTSKIDSLEKKLMTITKKGKTEITKRIDILNNLVDLYKIYDSQKALLKANEALNLAKQIEDKKLIAHSLINIAKINFERGNYEKTMDLYKEALAINTSINNEIGITNSLIGISAVYFQLDDYEKAQKYSQDALKISEKIKYNKGTISSLNIIGLVYYRLRNLNKALFYFQKILTINHDNEDKSSYLNNIGCVYREMGNKYKAMEYFKQALELNIKSNNKNNIANSLLNIGAFYQDIYDYKNALKYFNQAIEISKEIGNRNIQAIAYSNLGKTYLLYKQYDKAIEYLNKSQEIAVSLKTKNSIKLNYLNMYKTYVALKKYPEALRCYEQFVEINNSILNIEKQNQISNLQIKFEVEKKDLEIKEKQNEIRIQKIKTTYYIISSIVALILIVLLLKYNSLKKKKSMQKELDRSILKSLMQQMNPHFIFNSLNSINYYISVNDRVKSNDYLSMFANLMRLVLDNSQNDTITLQKEIDALRFYLELESLRFEEKLSYEVVVDKNLDLLYYKIPPLIIQPYVENAIWHGIMHKETPGKVEVNLKLENNYIVCTVEDDGIGRENAMKHKKRSANKSYGTTITRERLRLLNLLYNKSKDKLLVKYIDLKDENGIAKGTRVEIYMPVIN